MTPPSRRPPGGIPGPGELRALQGALGADAAERAWGDLLAQHDAMMHAAIRGMGLPPGQEQEDLVQEAWQRAFLGIATYRGQGPIGGWLRTITERVVTDRWRAYMWELSRGAESLEAFPGGAAGVPDPTAPSVDVLLDHVDLERTLETLHPADQELWRMRVTNDMDYKEIASALSLTPKAAYERWQRLVERLRELVEGRP